jgi:hypothetical protein
VRKLKGGSGKFKEREDSDDKEESLSITMETKPIDEENEDNQKENQISEEEDIDGEVNLEAELISALEEIDRLREENIKQKKQLQKHEKKDHDLEETKKTIIILKTQLEEAKRIEEVVRSQLKEKEENCEKLEAEIVSLRKELEKTIDQLNRSLKFGKSTEILDNILSFQRSPFIKTGLGYDDKQNTTEGDASIKVTKPSEKENEENPESYANILKGSTNNESNNRKGNDDQQKPDSSHKNNKNEFRRVVPPQRPFTNRYQNLFLGYCFSCNNFGHKAIDCRAYARSDHVRDRNRGSYKTSKDDYVSNKTRSSHGFANINYNSFSPLLDIECYKCNNYGHIAHDCRSNMIKSPKQNKEEDVLTKHREEYTRVWKRKQEEPKKEECGLALYAQNEGNQWYIDSGCSKHMTGDQTKFLTLKEEKGGSVTFGDKASARIVGKGIVSLDNGKTKTHNVLYVEGLKHNILSVIQMCDQGYNLTFHSKGCEIRKATSGRLVENANKTSRDVYILDKVKGEKCCMGVISLSSCQ